MHLMSTAIEQDAPLQNILADMSRDYERLNDLMNRRESDLMGRSILIIMFVSVGLPFLIAFIVGLLFIQPCGADINTAPSPSIIPNDLSKGWFTNVVAINFTFLPFRYVEFLIACWAYSWFWHLSFLSFLLFRIYSCPQVGP